MTKQEAIIKAVELYQLGKKHKEIAEQLGVRKEKINIWIVNLRKNGANIKRPDSTINYKEIAKLFQ